MVAMDPLDSIVRELKTLPAGRLREAADYIHRLREEGRADRLAAFRETAGSLSAAEADDLAQAIQDCERVDESGW